jgi:hypothetical protein
MLRIKFHVIKGLLDVKFAHKNKEEIFQMQMSTHTYK